MPYNVILNKHCLSVTLWSKTNSVILRSAATKNLRVVTSLSADSSQGLGMTGWRCREPMVGMAALRHPMSFLAENLLAFIKAAVETFV
ncbi:MAG: hypothetical protein ACI4TM_06420 [Candidatus Cryptobacteroides sp.]